jgi:DNA polymerase
MKPAYLCTGRWALLNTWERSGEKLSDEQISLFPEFPEPARREAPGAPRKKEAGSQPLWTPFLPDVKKDEAYLDMDSIEPLGALARKCQRCSLSSTCSQVVFADGAPISRLMLVGEGPGADEDAQGLPFVGRAGQLLNKILQASEISREEVYITNVVKCRPPGNRIPNPEEVRACRGYLEAQIRIIRPAIIVCLGALATQTVVDPRARITGTRGHWFVREGIKIMPTYHPAALLRREELKRPTWEDFKQIRDAYRSLDA